MSFVSDFLSDRAHYRSAAVVLALGLSLGTLPAFGQTASDEQAPDMPETAAPAAVEGGSPGCALQISLENPEADDLLMPGVLEIDGSASDSSARGAAGIDRVQVFLGNRDLGAPIIGNVSLTPSVTDLDAAPEFLTADGLFRVLVDVPDHMGPGTLFAYAHSSATGQEAVVQVPIAIVEQVPTSDEAGSDSEGTGGITVGGSPIVHTCSIGG